MSDCGECYKAIFGGNLENLDFHIWKQQDNTILVDKHCSIVWFSQNNVDLINTFAIKALSLGEI